MPKDDDRPRKAWVERAAKTGNWTAQEKRARRKLRRANAEMLARRSPGRPREDAEERREIADRTQPSKFEENLEADARSEEEDEFEEAQELPEEESAAEEKTEVVTLELAYIRYRDRGGNREIFDRVLAELGDTPIEEIDRSVIIATARKLYPKWSQGDRAELVIDPLEEVLGFARTKRTEPPPQKEIRAYDAYAYWLKVWDRQLRDIVEFEAWKQEMIAKATEKPPDPLYWFRMNRWDPIRWTSITSHEAPADPPEKVDNGWRPATNEGIWHHRHRGQLSKLHGTEIRFGPPEGRAVPIYAPDAITGDLIYIGHLSAAIGRPRKHEDKAAKQRAYRERKKMRKKDKDDEKST
jgi:hypothetical protein